jgi:hypothetical protein
MTDQPKTDALSEHVMPIGYYVKKFNDAIREAEDDGYGVAIDVVGKSATMVLFCHEGGEEAPFGKFTDENPYGHRHG